MTMTGRNETGNAFTLAEVLITLGVIGVVAAVTMPTLVTNIQERVRKEQVRTVKYKLTKATDKMNSLGKIGHYATTMDFVTELKKHLSIAKVCANSELDKCWPSENINAYQNGSSTLSSFAVKDLKKGIDIKALALGTKTTETVGIVTGDGVPILLVYSPKCSGFDEAKTYTWSVQDGKPVTNATTNCISAIFDINGAKGPNKIGTDVRTLNSLFGSTDLGIPTGVGVDICKKMKQKYAFQYCDGGYTKANNDRWVGAIYECDKLGLHLPDIQTLATIAVSRYGNSTIGPYTVIFRIRDCKNWIDTVWGVNETFYSHAEIICNADINTDPNSAINDNNTNEPLIDGFYFGNYEHDRSGVFYRNFEDSHSRWFQETARSNTCKALCVGD